MLSFLFIHCRGRFSGLPRTFFPWYDRQQSRRNSPWPEEGKTKEAIEVFRLNVAAFPKSWNVYDSLGEAYMDGGEKKLAILNYEGSLELNPSNTGAAEALKKLRGAP